MKLNPGYYDIVKYFIENGADAETEDDMGRSVQDIAEMLCNLIL